MFTKAIRAEFQFLVAFPFMHQCRFFFTNQKYMDEKAHFVLKPVTNYRQYFFCDQKERRQWIFLALWRLAFYLAIALPNYSVLAEITTYGLLKLFIKKRIWITQSCKFEHFVQIRWLQVFPKAFYALNTNLVIMSGFLEKGG